MFQSGTGIKCIILVQLFLISTLYRNIGNALEFKYHNYSLNNGMQVVLIPNNKVPVISHMVWYKVGAMDDPRGKSGLAHFLEHLLFKGTKQFGPGEFSKIIAKSGGNDNAFTGKDFTGYYQNIAKEKLELVMKLESDRMRNVIFDPEEIIKERNVIIEERRQRTDNSPKALLSEQMKAALFLNHPFSIPIIGWQHEMEGLTLEDAKQFYQHYYAPNNAILVVSGDVTIDQFKPLVAKYYGAIPKGQKPNYINLKEPKPLASRSVKLVDKRVATNEWSRYYLAPSYDKLKHDHVFALLLLSKIIGGGSTSRLYQKLVVNEEIAADVGTFYDDLSKGPSIFAIYGVPTSDHDLMTIESSINEELLLIASKGVTKEELERAKNLLIADTIYAQEDLKSLAYIFGKAIVVGAGIDYVNNWEKNIRQVTEEQIKTAVIDILKPSRSVTGYLLKETN